MDLSKLDSKIAIESRLVVVKQGLAELDKLTGKAEKLESELAKLKEDEVAILKDQSREDDAKLPDLLSVRGAADLKQAAINGLRGEPSSETTQSRRRARSKWSSKRSQKLVG